MSSIAVESGVSRATIYNKEPLKRYVELRLSKDVPEIDVLREKVQEMQATIEKLKARDGELLLAQMEVERLKSRVQALESALERQSEKRPVIKVISGGGRTVKR